MSDRKSAPPSGQQRGGFARSEGLSPARRSQIASRAAQARWRRDADSVGDSEIEDLQMNTDTIDAADILVTELNEQVVTLSRSGARALESGQIGKAKSMIRAIENTQGFLDRAEQLKVDIKTFYEGLIPQAPSSGLMSDNKQTNSDQPARRQDRTDRALLNARRDLILRQLETKHSVRLNRRSSATYKSEGNEIGIVCTISKWYADGDGYWYAYHSNQDQFLSSVRHGYFVLGMMDSDTAIVLPLSLIKENLNKLSTTKIPGGETYWHINIDRGPRGALSLHRTRGEPSLPLDSYIMQITLHK
jgi:hypothetical protein